ncbi:hypothetical protein [Devosia sp.]|uniref:hypothetical protein n=1 Tax=Devosia sp. TaxID=1871048 RepID=UPI003A90DB53
MRETVTLQLLGTPALKLADGTTVELRQKAYALAALLYLEFHGHARRAIVAERLWNREGGLQKQASNNLRQMLMHTRGIESKFDFELFAANGTQIQLSQSILLDLREIGRIRSVTEPTELERLMGFWRGELLAGITDLEDEFSKWLLTERARLEDQFASHVIIAAQRLGGPAAHAALNRLAEIRHYSDDVCRAHVQLYLAEGNVPAARRLISTYVTRGGAVDPETSALVDPPTTARPSVAAAPRVEARETPYRRAIVPRVVLLPPLLEARASALPKHLAPALIEDVTMGLSRLKSIAPIAPHSAWHFDPFGALDEVRAHAIDYAVESRIAPDFATGELQLAIRLVRSSGREIVWMNKFAFGSELAADRYWDMINGIAVALADSIETAELQRARTARDADAYGYYLAGRHNMRSFELPKIRRARQSFKHARQIEPEVASLESAMARSYVVEWVLRSGSDNALLDKAKLHAERAVAIDPTDGTAYRELGRVALFEGDLDLSLEHLDRAAHLAPNHADVLADYADTLVHNSDFVAARQKIDAALRLNPMPPDEYIWTLGGISFFLGQWEEALSHLTQMQNQDPALRLMAASAAMAGQMDLARKYRLLALEEQPDFVTSDWISRMPQRDPADVDLYLEALRKAGFK